MHSLFDEETSVGVIHRPPFVAEKACFSPTHEGSSCSDENLTIEVTALIEPTNAKGFLSVFGPPQ